MKTMKNGRHHASAAPESNRDVSHRERAPTWKTGRPDSGTLPRVSEADTEAVDRMESEGGGARNTAVRSRRPLLEEDPPSRRSPAPDPRYTGATDLATAAPETQRASLAHGLKQAFAGFKAQTPKENTMNVTVNSEDTVSSLNSLLRGEISAVETYSQALKAVKVDLGGRADLEECQSSHLKRVSHLQAAIRSLGGEPAEDSGVWGTVAKAIEGSASALGTTMAIMALEEGEDHGIKEYEQNLEKLDLPSRRMVTNELLPAQIQTHDTLSRLKRRLAA